MLAGGTIGDLYGHRRVVLTGLGVFGVASLLAGIAPSPGVLVGARVLQGTGAALLLPGTLAIITHTFPEPGERARAIGVWTAVAGLSLPAGEASGAGFVDGFHVALLIAAGLYVAATVPTLALIRGA